MNIYCFNAWFVIFLNIHSVINILNVFNKVCEKHTGYLEVVNILLANRADPKIKNKNDPTTLDISE